MPLDGKFIIGNIIRKVIQKEKIDIDLRHNVIRSYMHSSDLAKLILILLFKEKDKFGIYNIGSDNRCEMNKLVAKISKKYDLKYKIDTKKNNLKKDIYIPNISKLRNSYSYYKKLDSFDAVIKTINEIKKNLKKNTLKL